MVHFVLSNNSSFNIIKNLHTYVFSHSFTSALTFIFCGFCFCYSVLTSNLHLTMVKPCSHSEILLAIGEEENSLKINKALHSSTGYDLPTIAIFKNYRPRVRVWVRARELGLRLYIKMTQKEVYIKCFAVAFRSFSITDSSNIVIQKHHWRDVYVLYYTKYLDRRQFKRVKQKKLWISKIDRMQCMIHTGHHWSFLNDRFCTTEDDGNV